MEVEHSSSERARATANTGGKGGCAQGGGACPSTSGGQTCLADELGLHLFKCGTENYVCDPSRMRVANVSREAAGTLEETGSGLGEGETRDQALESLVAELGVSGRPPPKPRLLEGDIRSLAASRSNKIALMMARACNMSCRYCYEPDWAQAGPGLMSREVAFRTLEYVGKRSRDGSPHSITFFGGEPLLNSRLLEDVVSWTQERRPGKMYYSLTTNAVILPDSIIRLIKKHNFGMKISIDGGPEVQNRMRPLRGGGASFPLVEKNVRRLKRVRRQLSARATLTANCIEPRRLAKEILPLGFTKIGFGLAMGQATQKGPHDIQGHGVDELLAEFELAAGEAEESIVEHDRPPTWFPFNVSLGNLAKPESWGGGIRCGFTRGVSIVDIDGSIFPCHRFVGSEPYRIGDIHSGLDELRLESMLRSYARSVDESCRSCWAYPTCHGACPWYVADNEGGFTGPDEDACRLHKRVIEMSMVLFFKLSFTAPEYLERQYLS